MPALTADYFGSKNIGNNYAWVYFAWGIAGVLGPLVGVEVRAATGGWIQAFHILAGSCLVGILLILFLAPPSQTPTEQA